VGADADQVGLPSQSLDVEPGDGLDGIGVQHGPGSTAAHQASHVSQGLDRAHLVVDQLDGRHGDVAVQSGAQSVQVDQAVGPGGHGTHLDRAGTGAARGLGGPQYTMVLDSAHHHRPRCRPGPAQHGQIGGLGPATGEDDVARHCAQHLGDGVAGLVHSLVRGPGRPVRPRGVAGLLRCQPRGHGVYGLGAKRRGGGMVQVSLHSGQGSKPSHQA